MPWSDDLTQSGWTTHNTTIATGQHDPIGGTSAQLLAETNATGASFGATVATGWKPSAGTWGVAWTTVRPAPVSTVALDLTTLAGTAYGRAQFNMPMRGTGNGACQQLAANSTTYVFPMLCGIQQVRPGDAKYAPTYAIWITGPFLSGTNAIHASLWLSNSFNIGNLVFNGGAGDGVVVSHFQVSPCASAGPCKPKAYVLTDGAAASTAAGIVNHNGFDQVGPMNVGPTRQPVGTAAQISYFYGGLIATGTITNAGTGGTDGTYTAKLFTGGAGTGATATVVVSGGVVTGVTIVSSGPTITSPGTTQGYYIGDLLSMLSTDIGSVTGFQYTVATLNPFQWAKPSWATNISFDYAGAGGPGRVGGVCAAATACSGGGGGGGAGHQRQDIAASALPSIIPILGGSPGLPGTSPTNGSSSNVWNLPLAGGGGYGTVGGTANSTGGGAGSWVSAIGATGGFGAPSGTAGAAGTATSTLGTGASGGGGATGATGKAGGAAGDACAGGGAGGGVDTVGTAYAGGAGGYTSAVTTGPAGGAINSNGNNGVAGPTATLPGSAPSGSGASVTGNSGNPGAASDCSGGAGTGAAISPNTAGNPSAGGRGWVKATVRG